jgi:hypothetical protein
MSGLWMSTINKLQSHGFPSMWIGSIHHVTMSNNGIMTHFILSTLKLLVLLQFDFSSSWSYFNSIFQYLGSTMTFQTFGPTTIFDPLFVVWPSRHLVLLLQFNCQCSWTPLSPVPPHPNLFNGWNLATTQPLVCLPFSCMLPSYLLNWCCKP